VGGHSFKRGYMREKAKDVFNAGEEASNWIFLYYFKLREA